MLTEQECVDMSELSQGRRHSRSNRSRRDFSHLQRACLCSLHSPAPERPLMPDTRSRDYQFIKENDREHSVGTMCRLHGVRPRRIPRLAE